MTPMSNSGPLTLFLPLNMILGYTPIRGGFVARPPPPRPSPNWYIDAGQIATL
jgi:hypothetical protein